MSAGRLGIDLGGTKIEGIALGPGGETLARRRVPTPRHDYDGTVRAVVALAREIEAEAGGAPAGGLGVGIPGSLSPGTGRVRNANSVWLNGRRFDADLAEAFGRPVRVANDANCFALSEARDGAGAGAAVVFGVITGTGVGGGVVVRGRVLIGRNGIAGEWGHTPLPNPTDAERPGPLCWCGRRGCVETWCAGPALGREFAAAVGAGEGQAPSAAEIADLAAAGDPVAEACVARLTERLGRSLAGVINVLDPDVIVLGGGLSNLPDLPQGLADAARPHIFSDVAATAIRLNRHGDASGVRGAAWLWNEDET
ncbi:MAG TPA: ROK family protein [Paracoccaceae bacterium]|nr:ROK family protein [Paracoccaceae bacterium]